MAAQESAVASVWDLPPELWQQIEPILMSSDTLKPAAGGNGKRSAVRVVKDPFYILAPSPLADEHDRVLKQGETFAVFDHYGDITPRGLCEEGLYHEGTRFLSCLILQLGDDRPLFLSSTVKQDNGVLAVDLTNPDVRDGNRVVVPRGTLHLFRAKFLWDGVCYERLRLRNYGATPLEVVLRFHFAADFADIFEVRGTTRPRRGELLEETVEEGKAVLRYVGLDGRTRHTRLHFAPPPTELGGGKAKFHLTLPPKGETSLDLTITCGSGEAAAVPHPSTYDLALPAAEAAQRTVREQSAEVYTSNEEFNDWVNRSLSDLAMMISQTPHGPYPYAGVPWFSTPFGRDGILTALESLWLNPNIARGVLAYLAAVQAQSVIPEQDSEPGKILHETRGGEMAALGEVPFGRYYGSVDSTPLFVMLAAAYYQRTADREFLASVWPNVERALTWIDSHGDRDGDGFVEYLRHSSKGLVHQGWKDSHDSIFHADGTPAQGPIALCEVQGYVYAAKRGAADLAEALGNGDRAETLRRQAEALRVRFEEAFWCEELSTYAIALDGAKRPCRVRSSNAGHCLFTGIADPERARRTAQTLLGADSYSGWGIRTIAATEANYNPMSYHNGSVWPHDNALIADGLSHYRLKDGVLQVLTGLFDASIFVDLHRMPELFCGFHRRPGEGPTLYPVACAPQAWSAAAVFILLQAALGLRIDAPARRVSLDHPLLPPSLKEVRLLKLSVGPARLDLLLQRHGDDVGVNVLHRQGDVEVGVMK